MSIGSAVITVFVTFFGTCIFEVLYCAVTVLVA